MAYRDTPFFSWSPKREEMFHECELCYLFHYYSAHKGWLLSSKPMARATYRWKQANKIEDLMLYKLIEGLLEGIYSESKLSIKSIRTNVLELVNNSFKDSTTHKDYWYQQPKKVDMLYELVYEKKLDPKLVDKTTNKLDSCLNNFLHTKLVEELNDEDSELLDVRGSFKGGYSYVELEKFGIRAYAGVQVVHQRKDGKIIATLFKTNKKTSTLSQVGAVAKVVSDVLEEDVKKIIVRDEYLIDGTHKEFAMTDDLIKKTELSIEESVSMMSEFLVNKDIHRNEFVGFSQANYTRALEHKRAADKSCTMNECPYCEAVKRDLELYPKGYDPSVAVLKYSKKFLKLKQVS